MDERIFNWSICNGYYLYTNETFLTPPTPRKEGEVMKYVLPSILMIIGNLILIHQLGILPAFGVICACAGHITFYSKL